MLEIKKVTLTGHQLWGYPSTTFAFIVDLPIQYWLFYM